MGVKRGCLMIFIREHEDYKVTVVSYFAGVYYGMNVNELKNFDE
jgi:hypothetical protein